MPHRILSCVESRRARCGQLSSPRKSAGRSFSVVAANAGTQASYGRMPYCEPLWRGKGRHTPDCSDVHRDPGTVANFPERENPSRPSLDQDHQSETELPSLLDQETRSNMVIGTLSSHKFESLSTRRIGKRNGCDPYFRFNLPSVSGDASAIADVSSEPLCLNRLAKSGTFAGMGKFQLTEMGQVRGSAAFPDRHLF